MVFFGNSESEKKSWQDHLSEHHASQDRGPYKLPPGDLYIALKGYKLYARTLVHTVPTHVPQHCILQRDPNQLRSQTKSSVSQQYSCDGKLAGKFEQHI